MFLSEDTALLRQTLSEQVAAKIQKAIYSGELAPGETLPTESELCEQLQVSRSSVREALRMLEAQGLILSSGRPLSRTVSADGPLAPLRGSIRALLALRATSISSLNQLRLGLEIVAVRSLASMAQPPDLSEVAEALSDMEHYLDNVSEFEKADARFHQALVAASGNKIVEFTMMAVSDSTDSFLVQALDEKPEREPTVLFAEHQAIYEAIVKSNLDEATQLIIAHIEID